MGTCMKNWKTYRNVLFAACMALMAILGLSGAYLREEERGAWVILPDRSGPEDVPETKKAQEPDIKPRVALTFDDGPHSVYTERLLDGLKERGVQATFFLIGKNIPGKEALVERMAQEGHVIGNHTYDHVKLKGLSDEEACLQLNKTSELVKAITGKDTEYVRPPFGAWDTQLECGITLFPVLWNIDPLDWTTKNVDQVVNKVVTKVEEDDIILLHDIFDSSVEAALRIVDLLQEQGYEFVTVDELILE